MNNNRLLIKKAFAFIFFLLLFQTFTFCQTTKELKSTKDSLKIEEPQKEKTFKVVEEIPRFPACEGQGLLKEELKKCSEQEMIKFFYSWIKYPLNARKAKTQGEVIARFLVDIDGSISKVEILKDIGNGCGEEVTRVLLSMNDMGQKWIPPSSSKKPVKVWFTVPFQFNLISWNDYQNSIKNIGKRKTNKPWVLKYPIVITGINPETLEKPEEEKIFKVVEDMPRFPGCEGRGRSKRELKECSDNEMLKFIYSNIKYPEQARKNKTEGRVIARFIIESDLTIGNVEILNDIGDGCGEEVIRLIHLMREKGKWTPGKSRGKSPRVYFTIPVSFKLQSSPQKK